jgi:hypothetical protein
LVEKNWDHLSLALSRLSARFPIIDVVTDLAVRVAALRHIHFAGEVKRPLSESCRWEYVRDRKAQPPGSCLNNPYNALSARSRVNASDTVATLDRKVQPGCVCSGLG